VGVHASRFFTFTSSLLIGHASPITVTIRLRECGACRCSQRYSPCQVPNSRRPSATGIVMLFEVRTDRTCDAMSSGPSASWR